MRPTRSAPTPRPRPVDSHRYWCLSLALVGCVLAGSAGYCLIDDPVAGTAAVTSHAKRATYRSWAAYSLVTPAVGPEVSLAAATVPASPAADEPQSTTRPSIANDVGVPPTGPMGPVEGVEIASVDDDIRYVPTTRPAQPVAQHPPEATTQNVDTGKPIHEWQRLTDDWFGARPWLDDHGVSINANLTADWSNVFSGGTNPGASAFRELFNLNATIDTERLLGWKGGSFFVNFQNHAGENGSMDVGALQGTSNIDGPDRNQISELWYEQALLDDRVKVKVGKIDANVDFAHTPDADNFINGAFGAQQAILGFPTYPDPAMGVTAFVKPTEHTYVGLGVFDGSTLAGHPTGDIGPAGFFEGDAYFYIAEGGFDWTAGRGLDGRASVGVWHDTADFATFAGGTDSGTTGYYAMIDQKVWRENPDDKDDKQGLGLFVKYAYANPDVSTITNQIGAGVAWTGPIPGRDDDTLGLGVTWAGLSAQAGLPHDSEVVYEAFYRIRLKAWLSIQPDLQYVVNPDGGAAAADALVGTLRVMIDF